MPHPVSFTFDLEDDGQRTDPPRYEVMTDRVLGWLAERGVRGTFFVVGSLAERRPALVERIAAAGHELALHGFEHVPLEALGEERFAAHLERGRGLLEDAAGQRVEGFRAPIFSLTGQTPWAPERLAAAGFSYSSSVLPARNPLHGLPGAPRQPFRWVDGPVELPCPMLAAGRVALPYLGGVYLRYLPRPVVRAAVRRDRGAARWLYCHPYDFDAQAPFVQLPGTGWLVSRILHHRRRGTFARCDDVLRVAGAGRPLREVAAELDRASLPELALNPHGLRPAVR